MIILVGIISWPISKVLDKIMGGDELRSLYTNNELKNLLNIHEKSNEADLEASVAKIMTGALDYRNKTVFELMISWDDVYMININEKLNYDLLLNIFKNGHSRVPVYKDLDEGYREIVGILFAKDLILIDPDDEIPVSYLLNLFW